MSFDTLHKYPFLRLLFPFMAGLFCGDIFFFKNVSIPFVPALFCLFLLLLLLTYALKRYSLRWIFGFISLFVGFIGGLWRIHIPLERTNYDFPKSEIVYRAVITDKPKGKEKSVLCPVLLMESRDSLNVVPVRRTALLYISKDSGSLKLRSGDELFLSARIRPPENNRNFDEFDYARYLKRKGVSGTGYVEQSKWKLIAHSEIHSLTRELADYRDKLLETYRQLGFDGDEFAVLSALTVGYVDELSEDIRESYSVSGASHVLSLSGLHVGLISTLLLVCLNRLPDRWRGIKVLRTVLMLLFLWGFAILTGLSASVIRSVTMFSVLSVSLLFNRKSFSLNTVIIAAFLMLMYNPFWLFDVGFQLSFCAVAGILLFHSPINRRIPLTGRVGKRIAGLLSVSIAAQIGTAPLVLFYFSRFSTHFLLTNLVVIPLVSAIMYVAVLMLLTIPFLYLQSGIVWLLKKMITWLNDFIRWIEQLPYASIDYVWIDIWEVAGFYLLCFLFLHYLKVSRGKNLIACLSCLFVLCSYHTVMRLCHSPQQSLVFYNQRNCPVVHCVAENGKTWLALANDTVDTSRLMKMATKYWCHYHLDPPVTVKSGYTDAALCIRDNIVVFGNCRVCMISDNRWRNQSVPHPLAVDYLYLCKGYTGQLQTLLSLFSPHYVILDSSLSDNRRKSFCNECRNLGIPYHSLSEKGSAQFLL